MAKKVAGQLKLQVKAARRPVAADRSCAGSARHQHHGVLQGVQRADPGDGEGVAVPVVITYIRRQVLHLRDEDGSGELLPQEGGGLTSGSKEPGKVKAGSVTQAQVREIAEKKMKDLNANDVDAAMAMVMGSARSMGLEVVG